MSRKPKVFNTLKLDEPSHGRFNLELDSIEEDQQIPVVQNIQVWFLDYIYYFLIFRSVFRAFSNVQTDVSRIYSKMAVKFILLRTDFRKLLICPRITRMAIILNDRHAKE